MSEQDVTSPYSPWFPDLIVYIAIYVTIKSSVSRKPVVEWIMPGLLATKKRGKESNLGVD